MTVGLIGGRGFVGSGLARALTARGVDCTVIEPDNYASLAGRSFDVVINANGNSKKYLAEQSPKEEFEASVVSVQKSLIDFKYGCYVHCSTVDVYTDHEDIRNNSEDAPVEISRQSRYGFHKYCAEQVVRRYAHRWLILRFAGFIGEGMKKNSVYDILHDVPLRVDVDSRYQYLPTVEAGRILWELVMKQVQNEVFNVCGDGTVSLREVTELVPEYRLKYAVDKPMKEYYEINIDKIRSMTTVPRTRESVQAFLRGLPPGR